MASRNNYREEDKTMYEEHNDKFGEVIKFHPPVKYPKDDMSIIIDGDSICWISSYTGKDELGNKKPEYTPEEYEIAEGVADEIFMKIVNSCEEYFNVKQVYLCLKADNSVNPRYKWLPSYKQNRPPALPIISHLSKYLKNKYNGISPTIGETDDLLAELVSVAKDKCVIVSFDKDIKQLCQGNYILNYRQWTWDFITKETADYLFNFQMIVNDASDNIKLTPKVGEAFAKKTIKEGMNPWEYFEGVYSAYLKAWKEPNIAFEKMKLAWKLLKLHTIEEFKNLEITE